MDYQHLEEQDSEIYDLIKKEEQRQKEGLELIPSENYVSPAVLETIGSILNYKYAEGYPGRRYYAGNQYIDEVEKLAQVRAREVFQANDYHINVQPLSGSPANLAVYWGLLEPGDTILALKLEEGGHLTHGSAVNFSGRTFKFVFYPLAKDETLDYEAVRKLAREHKPKLILSGYTAYPRTIDFKKFHKIAKEIGAISMADISHISGLVIGGVHPSPFPFTDVVTTTTHKTLRGPRAAIIFCKPEYKEQIDKAVFPGMQGGPHEHTIAGIAVALKEAATPEFKNYAEQIVKNSKALAETLIVEELKLVAGGTDNHLMLIDLRPFGPGRGIFIEKALEAAHITVNKTTVPGDTATPFYPSGIRLGPPAVTSRGMKEGEMTQAGKLIARIVKEFATTELPDDKEKRSAAVKEFVAKLKNHPVIKEVKVAVMKLSRQFPVPGIE
ncbi:MAG: serine hydroxymethyltransferase [Candidatus Doudnabacteria bacterium]|nr:serine hydroxymethyltransferase [Candidatus Doudnabacteria bacterium]